MLRLIPCLVAAG